MSEAGATAFEVPLGGSLTRSFKDMEFIVSILMIRRKGKSEFAEFLPKRDEDSSESSSESDERTTGEREESSRTSS